MRILVANDDGIDSAHLRTLTAALRDAGHEITVIAPDCQKSGYSHSLSIRPKITAKYLPDYMEGVTAYSLAGTPVDCVLLGLEGIVTEKPDMVISGVNDGYNTGDCVYYSGTFGAAHQGAIFGIPSVALSCDFGCSEDVVKRLCELVIPQLQHLLTSLPARSVASFNMPKNASGEIVICKLDKSFIMDEMKSERLENGDVYLYTYSMYEPEKPDDDSDVYWLLKRRPTLSVITDLGTEDSFRLVGNE
ncbi:MAG: 5'/3'-nucleotidase SurE [Eubacteriales bacterium]|nr:5'/3'-nucleotidase SurE [Eubacteriales bacterium]MDD3881953.1 5'/3'-nucleotidase SurE [Eubacteriales bacterium]MDD4513146.1 5'/3'-nucleotidase SurE [Eubacteriales bacterium]